MTENKSGVRWIILGAVLGGLSVALGAFAAHGLDQFLLEKYAGVQKVVTGSSISGAEKYLADFKTAAQYQMYHALAIILLGVAAPRMNARSTNVAGQCFLWGTALFSGSLYCLVLSGITWLGAITPIGGVLFLVGWGAFAVAARPETVPANPG